MVEEGSPRVECRMHRTKVMALNKFISTLACTLIPVCTIVQEFDEATFELSQSDISVNGVGDYQLRSL